MISMYLQAMILANTFFKAEQRGPPGTASADADGAAADNGEKGSTGGAGREQRTYLLRELRDHDLWKNPR